ncbi:MAG: response regulator [Candidatus Margulisiibacteriota bacterium]|nr:MAG: response regulator [Candidatus Margulisiibacteriota bacterium]HCT86248.1 two-component system response regulator [Candidatus Margulisiibacteriota bacterium]HCY36682.1 two-component system response regulator [Candidatus Margulisiibacteriota bacterium]
MKLLIIDDDEMVRSTLRYFLQNNYEVYEAGNGKEGLEVLAREKISLVLLDYHMPGMNGIETLLLIKRDHPGVQVCMMSAEHIPYFREYALSYGSYDFIRKPFDLDEVKAVLKNMEENNAKGASL